MVRTTLAALIAQIRTLIGDPSGASQQFSDDAIQDALDRYREDVRYLELCEQETFQSNGPTLWLDYYDPDRGYWESDIVLYNGNWQTITPATSDHATGHWTFASNQNPPVYVIGKRFDQWHSAADLLETWATQDIACSFDFSTAGSSFHRSQKLDGRMKLAQTYLRKARITSARAVRDDINVCEVQ
jgi:hypothetical protein